MFKYNLIDELAYKSYLDATKRKDIFVGDDFVEQFERFVTWHRIDNRNLSHYYKINEKILRKLKLEKLNERI